jgi:hypothetical protein
LKFFKQKKKNVSSDKTTKKEKKAKKGFAPLTVQDLLEHDEITDKGILRIGNSYTLVMETDQTNTSLLDFDENATLWNNFRTMLNSINVRHSIIVQSHFFDVSDFVKNFDEVANSLTNLTPELEFAKEDVVKDYWRFTEERNRDQRCYIIFRYNPDQEGIELSFETGNAMIDDFFKKTKSKTAEVDEEESRSIAFSVLEEIADLTYQLLHTLNIRSVRLNRLGVLNMNYATLNRDLTTSQRIQDVSDAHSFTEMKVSETPSLIAEALSVEEEDDIQLFASYDQNNLFKSDIPDSTGDTKKDREVLTHA